MTAAGVPLPEGLRMLRSEHGGGWSEFCERLATRLELGTSLEEVVAAPELQLPPMYQAVIRAGLRTGRLNDALLAMSHTLQRTQQARRAAWLAILYPTLVLILAYAGIVLAFRHVLPSIYEAQQFFLGQATVLASTLKLASDSLHLWIGLPVILFGVALVLLLDQLRWRKRPRASAGWQVWLPSRIYHDASLAAFCEQTAQLLEQEVPLAESIRISSQVHTSKELTSQLENLAGQLEAGQRPVNASSVPAYLHGLLTESWSAEHRIRALRRYGSRLDRQVRDRIDWFQVKFPAWLVSIIAVSMVTFYALAVFVPWLQVLAGFLEILQQGS